MNLERQVISLDLAKKLKELGIKQSSCFYWHNKKLACPTYQEYNFVPDNWFSAFTASELGELLPDSVLIENDWCFIKSQKKDNEYKIYIDDVTRIIIFFSENEANARAKMLIYLIENRAIEMTKETKHG